MLKKQYEGVMAEILFFFISSSVYFSKKYISFNHTLAFGNYFRQVISHRFGFPVKQQQKNNNLTRTPSFVRYTNESPYDLNVDNTGYPDEPHATTPVYIWSNVTDTIPQTLAGKPISLVHLVVLE